MSPPFSIEERLFNDGSAMKCRVFCWIVGELLKRGEKQGGNTVRHLADDRPCKVSSKSRDFVRAVFNG